MRRITIAIDGPAASGKSTTAASVAEALGYCHLNSGLLYRAITWASVQDCWDDTDEGFRRGLEALDIRLDRRPPTYAVLVAGREVGDELVSPETSDRVSAVAAREAVRRKVLSMLRAEGLEGGIVCDGRDIGTVVFPDAELKVYLLASAEERGRRRLRDHGVVPTPARIRREAERLQARDQADSSRELSPLRKAADAVAVDTTNLSPTDVVARIVELARSAEAGVG